MKMPGLKKLWARVGRVPGGIVMNTKLAAAIEFAKAHETTRARDFSDQEITFGTLLGSIPTERAATNGLIIRHGYIVGEFGDTGVKDVPPSEVLADVELSRA